MRLTKLSIMRNDYDEIVQAWQNAKLRPLFPL
jgi:hypothetical protein